ncbi:MAG: Vacuolar protein-sorting-associated protein 28 [Watsoniomyces obsoletus]|nr:MAG: Vacuolar protein-sorting-associated protein 28 [Watsoniomyces obsoletus]
MPPRYFQGPPPSMDAGIMGRIEAWLNEMNPRDPHRSDAYLDEKTEDEMTRPGSRMEIDSTEGSSESPQNPPNTPSDDDDNWLGIIDPYLVEGLDRLKNSLNRILVDQQNQVAIARRNRARKTKMSDENITIMNRMAIRLAKARGATIHYWTGRPRYPTDTSAKEDEPDAMEVDNEPIIPSHAPTANGSASDTYAIAVQLNQTIAQARYYRQLEQGPRSAPPYAEPGPSNPLPRPPIGLRDQGTSRSSITPEAVATMQDVTSEELDVLLALEQSLIEQEQRDTGEFEVGLDRPRGKQPTVEDNDSDEMRDD